MNIFSRLFIMFDQVSLQMHRPVGEVFDYCHGFNGLKMMAEVIQRSKTLGVASFLIPPDGMHSIQIMPSGECAGSFAIDDKIRSIKTADNYLLLMQYENYLWSGNYLMLTVDEEGTSACLYLNYQRQEQLTFLTQLDLTYIENEHQLIERVYKIILGEIHQMNQSILSRNSKDTPVTAKPVRPVNKAHAR